MAEQISYQPQSEDFQSVLQIATAEGEGMVPHEVVIFQPYKPLEIVISKVGVPHVEEPYILRTNE